MSPEELIEQGAGLHLLAGIALPLAALAVVIFRGRIGFLRFRAPAGAREPPLWGAAEIVLALAAWYLGQFLIAGILAGAWRTGTITAAVFSIGVQLGAAALTLGIIFHLVRRLLGQPAATLGIARTSWWNILPALVLWALTLIPIHTLHIAWSLLLHHLGSPPSPQDLLPLFDQAVASRDFASVALFMISGVVVAPIAEEILARGLIHGCLRERWGTVGGGIASSLIFAAMHASLSAFLPLAVLGFILAGIYDRTRSLYPAILFHAVFNGATFAERLRTGLS